MKICQTCGAEYELHEIKLPVYDKDKIPCIYCQTMLVEWAGKKMYAVINKSGPTKETR